MSERLVCVVWSIPRGNFRTTPQCGVPFRFVPIYPSMSVSCPTRVSFGPTICPTSFFQLYGLLWWCKYKKIFHVYSLPVSLFFILRKYIYTAFNLFTISGKREEKKSQQKRKKNVFFEDLNRDKKRTKQKHRLGRHPF